MLFFVFMKENSLKNALLSLNQLFMEDVLIIFLFYSNQWIILKNFVTTLIFFTLICTFHLREKKYGKMSFSDVEITRENGKFSTTFHRKSTFSGVYTHFESFLPYTHKFSMLYILVYR